MDKKQIQKLIDEEKPAFDYARMLLTTLALWTVLIYIATELLPDPWTDFWVV